jgi:phytoene dehydrogenase-like protein
VSPGDGGCPPDNGGVSRSGQQQQSADVIVVGAGHNGLVAACYLAKAGLDVLVVERSATPGGMTCTNPMVPEAPDHLINEASIQASLLRTTPIVDELGLSKKYGLRQRLINPAHVQLNPEGESLAWWREMDRTIEEIKYFSKKDAVRWAELSETIAAATAIGLPLMMTSPVRPEWPNVLKTLKAAVKGRKELRNIIHWATISQQEAIEETFEHDMVRAPLTCNLPFMHFDSDASGWGLIYLGVYQKWGVAMFEGGTGAFPKALIRCLEDHGGRIRCSAPVEKFVMAGDRVAGVRLGSGEELSARKGVVTGCAPTLALREFLPDGVLDHKTQKAVDFIPTSSTGLGNLKINVALSGKLAMTRHTEWRRNARHLRGDTVDLRLPCVTWGTHRQSLDAAKACIRGEVPNMIPGLGQVTTAFDPTMAPEGHDTWWFWSGLVPSKPEEDWDTVRTQIEKVVLDDCAQYYEGLDTLEIARRTLTPKGLEERFGAPQGNVYHVDPIITRFGPRRPAPGLAGYATPVPGLFLSGSGTHPIAGINGLPGRNAARTVIKTLKGEP